MNLYMLMHVLHPPMAPRLFINTNAHVRTCDVQNQLLSAQESLTGLGRKHAPEHSSHSCSILAQPHRFLPSVDPFVSLTVVSQSAPAFPEPSHCNLVNNLMETKGQLLRAKEEGRVLQEELVEQKKFASVSQESQERCVCVCVDMCKVFW